jgi:hypothetical protein
MREFLHLNRRTHLYLALFLLPWFLMYGVSSVPFSHGAYFEELDKQSGKPLWIPRLEKTNYEVAIPEGDDLRTVGEQIVRDAGLQGTFGTYRQSASQINVYVYSFWKSTQAKYFPQEKRLVVEDRRFRWDHFLTGMHATGGFDEGPMRDLWGVIVDLVCLGMLLWVLSGLVMWWTLPPTRKWGWIAFASGMLSFALFLWKL